MNTSHYYKVKCWNYDIQGWNWHTKLYLWCKMLKFMKHQVEIDILGQNLQKKNII